MAETPLSAIDAGPDQRFKLVDLVPAAVVVATIGLLVLGDRAFGAASAGEESIDWWNAGLLLGIAFVLAIALRPFQFRLVRILEGYWRPNRLTAFAFELGVQRQLARRRDLKLTVNAKPTRHIDRERQATAREQLRRYPKPARMLPTALGNALRSAEDVAGDRYGLDAVTVFPRLFGLVDDALRNEYVSLVDQYDSSARLAVSLTVAAPVCTGIAIHQLGGVGVLGLCLLPLAWVFYRGAVESAGLSGDLLHTIIDLHRFDLLTRLHVPLPATPEEERCYNKLISDWLARPRERSFPVERYAHPEGPPYLQVR